MNLFLDVSLLELVLLALSAVALFVVLRITRWALSLVPMPRARWELIDRSWPVVMTIAYLLYALFVVDTIFSDSLEASLVGAGLVLLGFLALSWNLLWDTVSGAFVRAGRTCRVGDHIKVDGIEGRVERMAIRSLVVVTPSGDEAIVPYSRINRSSLMRTPSLAYASPRVFTVSLTAQQSVAEVRGRIREAALLHHWSSVVREPDLNLIDENTLEVTVFSLDPDRAFEIEALVRRSLGRRSLNPPPSKTADR